MILLSLKAICLFFAIGLSYVNIGNLCFRNVTVNGRIIWPWAAAVTGFITLQFWVV